MMSEMRFDTDTHKYLEGIFAFCIGAFVAKQLLHFLTAQNDAS